MGSYPDEFPFGIMEVVNLLNLRIRRQQANSVYVDCPFCGDRRGRMNVNFVKNVWRCNHCDAHGGMLALYAELNHTTTSDAYWEIAEALCYQWAEDYFRDPDAKEDHKEEEKFVPNPYYGKDFARTTKKKQKEKKKAEAKPKPVQKEKPANDGQLSLLDLGMTKAG